MNTNLEIGKRYSKEVVFSSCGAGQSPRTANRGAEYKFIMNDGTKLYWDTLSMAIINKHKEGDTLTISFSVVSSIVGLENSFVIGHVREC